MCRDSSSDLVKDLAQTDSGHTYGLSPRCHRSCAFRCDVLLYSFVQFGYGHKCLRIGRGLRGGSRQLAQEHSLLRRLHEDKASVGEDSVGGRGGRGKLVGAWFCCCCCTNIHW
jgi:hypothetical protein